MTKQFTGMLLALSTVLWLGAAVAEDHHHLPKDIDAFHALLAPVWHARPGKERARNACAKAAEMEKLAKGIQSADATPLVAASAALISTCKGQRAEVDAALVDVHEAFHRLIDAEASAATR